MLMMPRYSRKADSAVGCASLTAISAASRTNDPSDGNERVPLAEALEAAEHLDEWERDTLLKIDLLESGDSGRFLEIPHDESRDAYADMEEFIETIANRRLQDRLSDAIADRGRVLRWLRAEEIEIID